jgi:hypothetical protein
MGEKGLGETRLKDCPFCGSRPEIRRDNRAIPIWFYVGCSNPECALVIDEAFSSMEEVERFWNDRSDSP